MTTQFDQYSSPSTPFNGTERLIISQTITGQDLTCSVLASVLGAQIAPSALPVSAQLLGSTALSAPQAVTIDSTLALSGAHVLSASGNFGSGTVTAGTVNTGALSASGAVTGTGFTNLISTQLASPPAIGGTTPAAGAFTALTASASLGGAGVTARFATPGPIGNTAPSTGAFTTLAASGTVSGAGISALFSAPAAIGSTTPNSGAFTTASTSGLATLNSASVTTTLGVTGAATFGSTVALHADPTTALQAATKQYVDSGVSGATQFPFRNLCENGHFTVANRGTAAVTTTGGYPVDRWCLQLVSDTVSASQQTAVDADRSVVGDEYFEKFLQAVVTGNSAAGAFSGAFWVCEDARRTAGRTISIGVSIASSLAGLNIGCRVYQKMGTGGSPSANVNVGTVTLATTTSWVRHTPATNAGLTMTIPTLQGKTLGTNGDSALVIAFYYSSGTTNAAIAGVGVQSGTFYISEFQPELGATSTAMEPRGYQQDLTLCNRYCYALTGGTTAYAVGSAPFNASLSIPTMYAIPTSISNITSSSNVTGPSIAAFSTTNAFVTGNVTATAGYSAIGTAILSAEIAP